MATKQTITSVRRLGWILCLLLCCAGLVRADEYYFNEEYVDIDYEIHGGLWIGNATVNLLDNAWIRNVYNANGILEHFGEVWASSGAILNIYGGTIDNWLLVIATENSNLPAAEVTIYGSDFMVDGVPVEPGTTELFLEDNILSGTYESGTEFDIQVVSFSEGVFFLPVKLGWVAGAPEIEVRPEEIVEFGDVEIGEEMYATVTVGNVGDTSLSLHSLEIEQAGGEDFGFIPLSQIPMTIEPNSVVEIEVVYMPSVEGPAAAVFVIGSNDPENPVVEVMLTGAGFVPEEPELTPYEQINAICGFYLAGLRDGTIVGNGRGLSGRARAIALGHQLITARHLIDGGYERLSLMVLWSINGKTNGTSRPVDFVAGPSVPELNAMVNGLVSDIKKR